MCGGNCILAQFQGVYMMFKDLLMYFDKHTFLTQSI